MADVALLTSLLPFYQAGRRQFFALLGEFDFFVERLNKFSKSCKYIQKQFSVSYCVIVPVEYSYLIDYFCG